MHDIIAASPTGDLTFLVTEFGKLFTPAGSRNWFRCQCDEMNLPHCSAHGLRKAGAAIAAQDGATLHRLMSVFGWLSLKQAELYTRAAQQKRITGEGDEAPHSGQRRNMNGRTHDHTVSHLDLTC